MRRVAFILIILSLILAACQPGTEQVPQSGRLLFQDQDAKQVLWLENGKRGAPIADKVERAALCASDGRQAVYYAGTSSEGTLSLLDTTGNTAPIKLATGAPMGCEVSGKTTFSPDGKLIVSLVYKAGAGLGAEYATGVLSIFDTASGKLVKEYPDTLSYAWYENTLNVVTARIDGENIASATIITTRIGTEQQTSYPVPAASADCTIVNVQTARYQEKLYVAIGERCTNPIGYFATLSQITSQGTIRLSDRKPAGGKFYADTNSHWLQALKDGKTLAWIVPDGRGIETGTLWRWDAETKQGETLSLFTVTDQVSTVSGRRFAPDPAGVQLPYIQRNPQGGETLWVWESASPESEPAQINDMIRSNKITALAWSSDGSRLGYLFVAADSHLSYIDKRGTRRDAVQGSFQSLVLSPTGDYGYTAQQVGGTYTLFQFRLKDGVSSPLVSGATLPPIPLLVS